MLRKLIIVGSALAIFAVPTVAVAEWTVIQELGPGKRCFVADRPAAPGEQQMAGPFESRDLAKQALEGMLNDTLLCNEPDDDDPERTRPKPD